MTKRIPITSVSYSIETFISFYFLERTRYNLLKIKADQCLAHAFLVDRFRRIIFSVSRLLLGHTTIQLHLVKFLAWPRLFLPDSYSNFLFRASDIEKALAGEKKIFEKVIFCSLHGILQINRSLLSLIFNSQTTSLPSLQNRDNDFKLFIFSPFNHRFRTCSIFSSIVASFFFFRKI